MRVAVPDMVSNSYFPAIAAVDLGTYSAEGIEVDTELIFPVTKAMEALRAGRVDFVAGSAHATLSSFPAWRGAKLIVALAKHMYWFLVLRSDLGAQRGDIDAIKGLRIGAAPGPDQGLIKLLNEAGISPELERVQIAPVPGSLESGVSFGVHAARSLANGIIDGFWANGMGAELAIKSGAGTLVLDTRRGDGPTASRGFTFPAIVTTDEMIRTSPERVGSLVRAIVRVQQMLKMEPELAEKVGDARFPKMESSLITELVRRDLPYYDPSISPETVERMNRFAWSLGTLSEQVTYEQVVGIQFAPLWDAEANC